VTRPSDDVLAAVARPGMVALGVIYAIVGLLAGQIAVHGRGGDADGTGAVETVAEQPFGAWLLGLLALGLLALLLWRVAQTIWGDPVGGDRAKDRLKSAAEGAVYASLLASSVGALLGRGGGDDSDEQARTWTARAMELPGGRVLVALAGLAILAYAARTFWKWALHATFVDHLDRSRCGEDAIRRIRLLGQVGYTGRSIAFALVGIFVVRAAWQFDSSEAKGLSQSMQEVAQSGWWPVLWVAAAGLVAFGALQVALGVYRRID